MYKKQYEQEIELDNLKLKFYKLNNNLRTSDQFKMWYISKVF